MPIKNCSKNGKPGFSWGNASKCWTYTPGDEESKKAAKKACLKQGLAIEGPEKFKKELAKAEIEVTENEILAVQLTSLFDIAKSDNMEEPSSESMPMCPDCGEPMDESEDNEDMMCCSNCGKEMSKSECKKK